MICARLFRFAFLCAAALAVVLGSAAAAAATQTSGAVPGPPPPPIQPAPRVPQFRDNTAIVVDVPSQEYTAAAGETKHTFTFRVSNRSSDEIVIERVKTSCGCSVARMPAQPWKLAAGGSGEFAITMDFTGKTGTLTKTATIETPVGHNRVSFSVRIPATENTVDANLDDRRARNLMIAAADRQAVFKGAPRATPPRPSGSPESRFMPPPAASATKPNTAPAWCPTSGCSHSRRTETSGNSSPRTASPGR